MTLPESIDTIQRHLARMEERYGKPVFDEWAIVSLFERKARILHYVGPRREDLQATFAGDIRHFIAALTSEEQHLGHFDFSRDAEGSQFDAYLVLGEGCFLICNNTNQSMAGITRDPRWLEAQVPFAELGDRFAAQPLIHLV